MGVHGLWQLLHSTGRPLPLESLENKVLAVDISVWLHQLAKGMRDSEGNPLPNAHLQGLFTRICKLLYYRIKPIFVFDGGVPELKKQTLRARRERREFAEQESGQATRKLLTNLIRSQAISHVLGEGEGSIPNTSVLKLSSSKKPDMFELPPIPESSRSYLEGGDAGNESPEDSWEERMMTRQLLEEEFQDLDAVDVHSDDFKSLPPEIQHEIIIDLKEKGKRPSRRGEFKPPEDSMDFSKYQITKLLKQSKLSNRLYEVRKEMSTRSAGELTQDLEKDFFSDEVQSSRVVSEDTSHYILIKGLRRKDELKADEENEFSKNVTASAKEIESSSSQIVDKLLKEGDVNKSITGIGFNRVDRESIIGQVERESSVSNKTEVTQTNFSKSINKKEGKEETITRKEFSDWTKYDNQSEDNLIELSHLNTADLNSRSSSKYDLLSQTASSSTSSALVHEAKTTVDNNGMDSEKERIEISDDIVDLSEKEGNTDEIKTVSRLAVINKVNRDEEDDSGSEDEFIEVPEFPSLIDDGDLSTSINIPGIVSSDRAENSKGVLTAVNIKDISKDVVAVDLTGVEDINEGEDAKEAEFFEVIKEAENVHTSDSSASESKNMAEKFQVMNEMNLHELQYDLELESTALKAERGRQERLATSITDQMHAEAQELLRLFGIPYLVSPLEAEAQCAQLDQAGHTNGTVTDDSDIWLFGGHRVYKNLFQQKKHVEFYTDTNIKAQLGLTRQHLINFALLCGSDYTEGIQGVGPITAIEILAEFPGEELEGLVALKSWWEEAQTQVNVPMETSIRSKLRELDLRPGFPSPKAVEAYMNPVVDDSDETFSWSMPDLDELRQFALVKLNWTKAHVDEILLPVLKQLNKKQTQLSIRSFFQPENFIEPERIKSKRLQKAVKTFLKPSQSADGLEEMDVRKREEKKILLKSGVKGKGKGKGKGKYSKAESVKKDGKKNNSVPKWKDEVDLSEESSSEEEGRLEGGFILNEGDEDEENKSGVSISQTKGKAPAKRGLGPKSRSHRGGNSLAKEENSVIPHKRRKGIISLNAKDFERAIGCSDSESSTDDWLCQVDMDGFSGKREEKGKKAASATQSKGRNLKAKEATVSKAKEANRATKRVSCSSHMSAQNNVNKIYLSKSSSDSDS